MFEITSPPRLHIQPLPKDAQLISLDVDTTHNPAIRINAWMRNGWATGRGYIIATRHRDAEDFIEDHCQNCNLYFDVATFSRNSRTGSDHDLGQLGYSVDIDNADVDEDDVLSIQLRSPCPAFRNGLGDIDGHCPAGNDVDAYFDETVDDGESDECEPINLDYVRFTVTLEPDTLKPYIYRSGYHYTGFKAAMQLVSEDAYDEWLGSATYRVANAYGGDANGEICWGYNTSPPANLADCAQAYAKTPSNNDLLALWQHKEYQETLANLDIDELNHSLPSALFGNPLAGRVALLLAPATPEGFKAFMLLGSSSFAQLIQHPNTTPVVALFATWREDVSVSDGQQISCYVSEPFPDGTRWLALPDPDDRGGLNGQLIGQLAIPKSQPTPTYA